VPALEEIVAREGGRPEATRRLRIGMYTFEHDQRDAGGPPPPKDA
jgi:hypothetical protein